MSRWKWPAVLGIGATLLVACGGGGYSTTPLAAPSSAAAPFVASTTYPVSSSGTLNVPLAAPSYSGEFTLTGVSSQVSSGLTLQVTLQNAALSGFPALQQLLRAVQGRQALAASVPIARLIYLELEFSAGIAAGGGTLSLTVPSSTLVAGDAYYLSFFDPNALSLGWQADWAGPAAVSGSTLSFTLPPSNLLGLTTYGFVIYGISSSATPPSPVPSASASASASPSTSPSPSTSASPSPTPTSAPNALQANPTTVAIPAPGVADTKTVVVTESGYNGTLSQSNSCGGSTPIATFSATSAQGPSWNLIVTGVAAGTCVATISDSNAQSVTVSITVTASGFSIQSSHRKGP
jgi:hypothetical protein